jgi:hypothetical protein
MSNRPDENGVYHYPAYGSFLNIIGCLPPDEQREYWWLYDRRAIKSRQLDQQRFKELGDKAHALWEERRAEPRTADNDLDLYAQEIGARMRARQSDDSEEPRPAGS